MARVFKLYPILFDIIINMFHSLGWSHTWFTRIHFYIWYIVRHWARHMNGCLYWRGLYVMFNRIGQWNLHLHVRDGIIIDWILLNHGLQLRWLRVVNRKLHICHVTGSIIWIFFNFNVFSFLILFSFFCSAILEPDFYLPLWQSQVLCKFCLSSNCYVSAIVKFLLQF